MLRTFVVCLVLLIALAASGRAQTSTEPPTTPQPSEDVEPRIVGRGGTTWIGFSGFLDKFSSAEETLPFNYTAQADVCRFLTSRVAIRAGLVGSGQFGLDEDDEPGTGSGAAALHASGGALYFFSPQSLLSAYVGAEYWAQLTRRPERDLGSVLGTAGIQATVSSRASVFVQGGFGVRLNRGDENELVSRIVAQLGFRVRM
ncbi:MAG TPA: hypothetical protein VFJ02_23075 [Vicinamibacterales bacterium]|nr:hypothetical protein [Vicinamibacterales bacterium]